MHPVFVGAIAGAVLSATTSYLVTGRLFHRYQISTPGTWREETWWHHAVAMALQAVAGAAVGGVFVAAGAPPFGMRLVELGGVVWGLIAAVVLVQAVYVRWHRGFVAGLLVDWALIVVGVSGACAWSSA
jgi:hypothetical protein